MSGLDKLRKWVESGAAKPLKGETVEKIIKRIDRISKAREEKK